MTNLHKCEFDIAMDPDMSRFRQIFIMFQAELPNSVGSMVQILQPYVWLTDTRPGKRLHDYGKPPCY